MRRLLKLSPVCRATQHVVEEAGQAYLSRIRSIDATTRASSIASYEDGGLEKVFGVYWDVTTGILRYSRPLDIFWCNTSLSTEI